MAPVTDPPIESLGTLGQSLAALGFRAQVQDYAPEVFGNFVVRFEKHGRELTITRDRGQFILGGDRATLEPVGLWRAFESATELEEPLIRWLKGGGDV